MQRSVRAARGGFRGTDNGGVHHVHAAEGASGEGVMERDGKRWQEEE